MSSILDPDPALFIKIADNSFFRSVRDGLTFQVLLALAIHHEPWLKHMRSRQWKFEFFYLLPDRIGQICWHIKLPGGWSIC